MKYILFAEPATLALAGLACILLFLVFLGAIIIVIVRYFRKPAVPSQPAPAPATQVVPPAPAPRHCPQCGSPLNPDVPEGLCPACLLKHGIATEGGVPPGTPPFTPPPLAELQKLFPQLEILEPLGQGGMGAVYKARQPALDRIVALKILAPKGGGDLDFAGRFSREARALARLSHPNIVAVYDFGQIQRGAAVSAAAGAPADAPTLLHYFIMEFVDGLNLRQLEQAGKLSPREALEIIPQICAALQFAHDEGIVHRDIKPENVLVDKKGRVKIADFGLAKIVGQEKDFRLTGARDVMGTPHYMAPEQVEKPQEVDHRADIYSLGVVFYELLTGELPIGKFQPPSAKVRVDVRLDDVVLRSLAKEPERRYQHASEVKTDVETIAHTPTAPRQATPPAPKPDRFWRWFAVAIVALIALPIFIAILGMLAAIAIPNFVKARHEAQLRHEKMVEATTVDLKRGLVALWHADGNADDSVNGHNGVMEKAGFTDGVVGQAFAFDPDTYPWGTYTGVKVPDSPAFELTNALSIVGWVRPRGNGYIILSRGDHRPGFDPYTLSLQANDHLRFYVCEESSQADFVEARLTMNAWSYVAATYDDGVMRLYTNGVLVTEKRTAIHPFAKLLPNESPGLGIGNLNDGGNNFPFIGDIDELALYDRALSPAEVRAGYETGRKAVTPGKPAGPYGTGIVASWNADENVKDHAGNSHGVLMNGATYAPGIVGEAFQFDGNGAYVKVPPTPALNSLYNQITIEFWMKPDADNEMQDYQGLVTSDFWFVEISNGYGGTMGVNFGLGKSERRGNVPQAVFGGSRAGPAKPALPPNVNEGTTVADFVHISDANDGGAPVSAGEWHHIAVTYDGSKMQLYVEGKAWGEPKEFSGPIRPMLPRSSLCIGSEDGRATCQECIGKRYFKGLIDEVKIYNRARSAQEIAADYERNKPATAATAASETWSPTLAPGETPDFQQILNGAKSLMNQGSYAESLQRFVWYFKHTRNDAGQKGVRLSFALSDWMELGRRYPKAKQALIDIRDHDTREIAEGRGYFDLFMEVNSINGVLDQEDATVALFKTIGQSDKKLAEQCYGLMEPELVRRGEYELCLNYVGNPQARFETVSNSWQMMRKTGERQQAMWREQSDRMQKMAETRTNVPGFPNGQLPFPPELSKMADKSFVAQTRNLIEILVATGRKSDAEQIRDEALAALDDSQLKSAVSDAEEKVQKHPDISTGSKPAVAAATKWLATIDAGNYSECWKQASAIFQGGVTEAAWENSMNTFRKPLGGLISRKLTSAQQLSELPGAPDGQYVLMQFNSSFVGKKSAVETLTFMLEKDGQWRSAGYFIK